MSRPPSTGLVVPVEAAHTLIEPWSRLLPTAGRELPPHVTALWPFLPGELVDAAVERRLADLLAGMPAFSFTLARVAELADAAVLVPEPTTPFDRLTRALWHEWPECPPYGGAFDHVLPHLAVAVDPTTAQRREIENALAPRLPLKARATEILLVEETSGGAVRPRRRFALGG